LKQFEIKLVVKTAMFTDMRKDIVQSVLYSKRVFLLAADCGVATYSYAFKIIPLR
jgi:hypothetical protein